MRWTSAKIVIFSLILACVNFGISCSTGVSDAATTVLPENPPSSADREVNEALNLIEKMPDSTLGYNHLAVVYIKKARHTGDFGLNSKAETSVDRALAIAPDDILSRKLKASLHLTFHRFRDALELGRKLLQESPDDAFVYGVLTDANAELGNYGDAASAAQMMVDLKPNSSSYARVAHIRSLYGDHPGAVEMYKLAARTTDPLDKEAQSWCLTRLGDELWKNGKYAEAEKVYDEALQNFPGYYLALAGKGRNLASKGDLANAEKFLTDAQNRLPKVETVVLLGHVYTLLGNAEKARAQYELAEVVDQKLGAAGDQQSLALLWADRDLKLDQALEISNREYQARKDIYTADIYAWCLYKNGRLLEAKAAIGEAMRLKANDARILYHAGMIENGLGNKKESLRLLEAALKLNPSFDLMQAANARKMLTDLK